MKLLSLAVAPLLVRAIPFDLDSLCVSAIDALGFCKAQSATATTETSIAAAAAASSAAPAASTTVAAGDLYPQLSSEIQALINALVAANATLNTLTTNSVVGLIDALQFQQSISSVADIITTATGIANATIPFNDQESSALANQVLGLEPDLFSFLNNVLTHKPAFSTAVLFVGDLTRTVEQNLIAQRQLAGEFSTAIGKKLTALFSSASPAIAEQIDEAFVAVINAYEGCSGLICLPAIAF